MFLYKVTKETDVALNMSSVVVIEFEILEEYFTLHSPSPCWCWAY